MTLSQRVRVPTPNSQLEICIFNYIQKIAPCYTARIPQGPSSLLVTKVRLCFYIAGYEKVCSPDSVQVGTDVTPRTAAALLLCIAQTQFQAAYC